MQKGKHVIVGSLFCSVLLTWVVARASAVNASPQLARRTTIGAEVSVSRHLPEGEEFTLPLWDLLAHGERLFTATWTSQEGGGRPLSKGTGAPLSDSSAPLIFPRNFNRLSAMDANSCAGCHNAPFGLAGGGGDFVTSVFVLAQRFDFVTFDPTDRLPTKGAVDEAGRPVTLPTLANSRATLGMFGAGYIEMLARQITADLQAIRDATRPGESRALASKGVSFGRVARSPEGAWDVSGVEGLPAKSLASTDPPGKTELNCPALPSSRRGGVSPRIYEQCF
jgi:hypothetical protein